MPSPLDALSLPFVRSALAALMLLAVAGGLLGSWVVLRRLAFFTHAVGAAAFPALVVAGPIGLSANVAGLAAGLGYAAGVERAARSTQDLGAATGLLLVASLGGGVALASDVVDAPADVDRLLFGTLLGITTGDIAFSAGAAAAALAGTLLLGRAWLASGFDPGAAWSLPASARRLDAVLLALVAAAAVAAVPAVGALLVTSLFIVPAATARLLVGTVPALLGTAVALAALEGVAGLYLAYAADLSPGPAIATLGAALYGCVALAQGPRRTASARGSRSPAPASDAARGLR